MDFGSVPHLDGIDFALAPEDPRTQAVLAAAPRALHPRFSLGVTGYSMRPWVGTVYPRGTPPEKYLEAYGRQFNAIELNATAYRLPDDDTIARWIEAVPAHFRFAPKFPQETGHSPDLAARVELAREFATRVSKLGERLGRTFLQLGPSVSPASLEGLRTLLDALPEGFPVAVEFRHPGWFRGRRLIPAAFDLLAERRQAAVITDVAGRRDVSHASLPCPALFVRFVGNDLDPSDFTRLDAWARRIGEWASSGLSEVSFFVHEPENLRAPEASNAFVDRLPEAAAWGLRKWTPPAPPPSQLRLL